MHCVKLGLRRLALIRTDQRTLPDFGGGRTKRLPLSSSKNNRTRQPEQSKAGKT
jgi:hypothetical protein